MDHAVAENVYAGNAMSRRLFFQYGVLLPRSPFGHGNRTKVKYRQLRCELKKETVFRP
jgi:alkyl sulfatase BDS1-like metallo-beta-lactamase superfamily hydrolase